MIVWLGLGQVWFATLGSNLESNFVKILLEFFGSQNFREPIIFRKPKFILDQHFQDQIFFTQNFWNPKFFGVKHFSLPKIFLTHNFFVPKSIRIQHLFWSKILLDQIFFGPKYWANIFGTQNLFGPKFLLNPKFFGPKNFFGSDPKFFLDQKFFGPEFYLNQKNFWTQNFLTRAISVITNWNCSFFSSLTFAQQVQLYLEQTFTWNSSVALLSLAC